MLGRWGQQILIELEQESVGSDTKQMVNKVSPPATLTKIASRCRLGFKFVKIARFTLFG